MNLAVLLLDQTDIPRLSEKLKDTLNRPISKADILETLKSMHHNKSSGFDGLPVEFYIVFFQAELLFWSRYFILISEKWCYYFAS